MEILQMIAVAAALVIFILALIAVINGDNTR